MAPGQTSHFRTRATVPSHFRTRLSLQDKPNHKPNPLPTPPKIPLHHTTQTSEDKTSRTVRNMIGGPHHLPLRNMIGGPAYPTTSLSAT